MTTRPPSTSLRSRFRSAAVSATYTRRLRRPGLFIVKIRYWSYDPRVAFHRRPLSWHPPLPRSHRGTSIGPSNLLGWLGDHREWAGVFSASVAATARRQASCGRGRQRAARRGLRNSFPAPHRFAYFYAGRSGNSVSPFFGYVSRSGPPPCVSILAYLPHVHILALVPPPTPHPLSARPLTCIIHSLSSLSYPPTPCVPSSSRSTNPPQPGPPSPFSHPFIVLPPTHSRPARLWT